MSLLTRSWTMGFCARRDLAHGFFQHLRGAPFLRRVSSQAPATNAKRRLLFPASTSRSRKRHGLSFKFTTGADRLGLKD